MKVTVLLRNDHDAIKALFDKWNKPVHPRTQEGRKDLFREIRREILIHSQTEHEIFYPAVHATASPEADELVWRAEREHVTIEKLLEELSRMNGTEKSFDDRMKQLMSQFLEHVEMEESKMFDEARKNLPEYRLEELGLEMEERRRILVTVAA